MTEIVNPTLQGIDLDKKIKVEISIPYFAEKFRIAVKEQFNGKWDRYTRRWTAEATVRELSELNKYGMNLSDTVTKVINLK